MFDTSHWPRRLIAQHVALFNKSERDDGIFSLSDFKFDTDTNSYTCPAGKKLVQYRRHFTKQRTGIVFGNRRQYRAERRDGVACSLKDKCCPGPNPRKLSVSVHETARDIVRNLRDTHRIPPNANAKGRDAVEGVFLLVTEGLVGPGGPER